MDGMTFAARAAEEVGYVETPTNRTKFAKEAGHVNGQPWCSSFVVAIARRCGIHLPNESAYTPSLAQGFRDIKRWSRDNPQPGDVVFFDFPDSVYRIQHVGIVEAVRADGSLTTIEGNTSPDQKGSQANGGGVYRRHRVRSYMVGFGRPTFPQEDDMFEKEDRELLQAIKAWIDKMESGVPSYGVEPLPVSTSQAHRNTKKIAAKLGITDAE